MSRDVVHATIPILHAVTTDDIVADPAFVARAAALMRAGAARVAVHVRAREPSAARLYAVAAELAEVQAACGAWVVVNDRVDVARAAGARGAQLTGRSMLLADARRAAAGALRLGASVHSADEARRAGAAGADWVVAGHVFRTPSHPGAPGRGLDFVRELVAAAGVPVVAIGGVTPTDVPALRAAGVHGVAAIRGVWGAADVERAVTAYLSSYERDGSPDDA
jgi:thiamine-phosphate diphosphorylase